MVFRNGKVQHVAVGGLAPQLALAIVRAMTVRVPKPDRRRLGRRDHQQALPRI